MAFAHSPRRHHRNRPRSSRRRLGMRAVRELHDCFASCSLSPGRQSLRRRMGRLGSTIETLPGVSPAARRCRPEAAGAMSPRRYRLRGVLAAGREHVPDGAPADAPGWRPAPRSAPRWRCDGRGAKHYDPTRGCSLSPSRFSPVSASRSPRASPRAPAIFEPLWRWSIVRGIRRTCRAGAEPREGAGHVLWFVENGIPAAISRDQALATARSFLERASSFAAASAGELLERGEEPPWNPHWAQRLGLFVGARPGVQATGGIPGRRHGPSLTSNAPIN